MLFVMFFLSGNIFCHRVDIRLNRETEEWYCASCGRTSDHIKKEDALVELEQFECELPTATRAKKNQDPTG